MKRLILLLIILYIPFSIHGQREELYMTWEDFVEEFAANFTTNEETETSRTIDVEMELERLEELHHQPIQINRLGREDLLILPFLDEAQADSILSYREQRRGFVSLGELQLIKGINFFTRGALSLFLRCDSTYIDDERIELLKKKKKLTLGHKLANGRHEAETHLDLPLYKREGYKQQEKHTRTNYYVGNNLHHVLRYRYNFGQEAAYGLSMEKDSGEPVGKHGFYPYGYLSGYVYLRLKEQPWSVVTGDFDLRGEEGLLYGGAFIFSKTPTTTLKHKSYDFRPHTSMDETRFFRGAAASFEKKNWRIMAFVSFRKLDARLTERGDTARTLLTTGLHRTIAEIDRKAVLNAFVTGGSVGYLNEKWGITLNGNFTHFSLPLWPEERFYNSYYFRGQECGGASLGYYAKLGKKLFFKGETAVDHGFKPATVNRIEFHTNPFWRLNLQIRHLSPAYRSLYGTTEQQGSRNANETGVSFSTLFRPQDWEITTYIDLFRFPEVSYTSAVSGALGLEGFLQAKYKYSAHWSFLGQYRIKTRQYTVTGYKVLEYRHLNRLRLAATYSGEKFNLHAQGDIAYAFRQTGKHSLGYMCSARADWRALKTLRIKGFAGWFHTDDYDTALYTYVPRLRYSAGFNAFAYYGIATTVQAEWQIIRPLYLALRYNLLYYFDRKEISSGTELINKPLKNDLSIQIRLRID